MPYSARPPGLMSLLRMMTLCPACAIFCAAKSPAGPAPTTKTVFKWTPLPLWFVVAPFADNDAFAMPKFPLLPLVDMTGILDQLKCAVRDSRHNDFILCREAELHLVLNSPGRLQREALLLAVREIRHVRCHSGTISNVHVGVGLLARADALDPVSHVVNIASFGGERGAVFAVCAFRIVLRRLRRLAGDHVSGAG